MGKSRKEIRDQIFSKEINVKVSDVPPGWSLEAADFINKLLRRKSKERLGRNGIVELKEHSWLRGIQWGDIYRKEVTTPYLPKEGDNFDANYCNKQDQIDKQAYEYYLHKITNENYFNKFYYNFYDEKHTELWFELDGVQYKFNNIHEDAKDTKNETTGRHNQKPSLGSTMINTPRLDLHASSLSQHTNYNFNQSNLSQRKLFASSQL